MAGGPKIRAQNCHLCGEDLTRLPEIPCPRCHRLYHAECFYVAGCSDPRCGEPLAGPSTLPVPVRPQLPAQQAIKASCVRRLAASMVDVSVAVAGSAACSLPAVALGVSVSSVSELFMFSMLSILLCNDVMLTGLTGASLGKRAVGIQVVDRDGNAPGVLRALVRELPGKLASQFFWGLGYLVAAFDSETRALHDRIAGTWVVESEA